MKKFTIFHPATIFLSALFMLATVQNVHGQPECAERSQNGAVGRDLSNATLPGVSIKHGCTSLPPIIVSKPNDDRERPSAGQKILQNSLVERAADAQRSRGYRLATRRHQATEGDTALRQLIDKAVQLNQEILRLGKQMSPEEARTYERRMQGLIQRMDQMSKKKGPAPCMKECDKAYPGWGKGKGWNRFWCKAACLVAAVKSNKANDPERPERTVVTPSLLR